MKTLNQLLKELYRLDVRADEVLIGDSLYRALLSQARDIVNCTEDQEIEEQDEDYDQ